MTVFTCESCGAEREIKLMSSTEQQDFSRGFFGFCENCHMGRTFKVKSE